MSGTGQIRPSAAQAEWLGIVRGQVESLRYGIVQVIVHDGKVTQIERTERTRLEGSVQLPENSGRR